MPVVPRPLLLLENFLRAPMSTDAVVCHSGEGDATLHWRGLVLGADIRNVSEWDRRLCVSHTSLWCVVAFRCTLVTLDLWQWYIIFTEQRLGLIRLIFGPESGLSVIYFYVALGID